MFKQRLDSILSTFDGILVKLEDFISKTAEDLGKNEIKIALLDNKKKEMKTEIEKANKVHANIRKILGD